MNKELIEQLNLIMSSDWLKEILKDVGYKSGMTSSVSQIIGEVYIYAFSTQSCDGIEEYINNLLESFKTANNPERDQIRANMLLESLAKKEGIPAEEIGSDETLRIMFLENYCKNGFVMHSFSEENLKNLTENGFQSAEERKKVGSGIDEIIEVAHIFENHGVLKACGTYPFYSGAGLYVEHDPRKVFEHSTLAPEWFFEFTGSNHNGLDSDVSTHPLIMQDYEACKQNVEDLCANAELSDEEKTKVMALFENSWARYGVGQKHVAIIPREVVGKADYSGIVEASGGMSNQELITSIIRDKFQIFQEHVGNSVTHAIRADEFVTMPLPDAKELFKTEFIREGKEQLKPSKEYLAHVRNYAEKSNFNMEYVDSVIAKITSHWYGKDAKKDVVESALENVQHRIETEQNATNLVKTLAKEQVKDEMEIGE